MVPQRKPIRRGWNQRFLGFRINCEHVPILPAWVVHRIWADPRQIPYLLVWKSPRDGSVQEAVRVARTVHKNPPEAESIDIKRTDGNAVRVYLAWRKQPHGGRSLLLRCWLCQKPQRALYGFKVGSDGRYYKVVRAAWDCRRCARLRYSSEGGYLGPSSLFRAFGNLPRPDVWLPYVFTDIDQALDAIR
jgi:hypothetical protein